MYPDGTPRAAARASESKRSLIVSAGGVSHGSMPRPQDCIAFTGLARDDG